MHCFDRDLANTLHQAVSALFECVERIVLLLKPSLMMRHECKFRNTGRDWTLPDRDFDLLAGIDPLRSNPKNLQFELDVL